MTLSYKTFNHIPYDTDLQKHTSHMQIFKKDITVVNDSLGVIG